MEAALFFQIASAAATVISAGVQAANAKASGNYNAAVADRNAGIARAQAVADADAQSRHARRVIGAARAGYGASGITDEGSPLDVLGMSAANAELDRQNILYRGELKALGYGDTAGLERMRADNADLEAFGKAGSAILLGAANYESRKPTKTATSGYTLGDYSGNYNDF